MTRAMEQLTQAQHKAAEALYKTTGAAGLSQVHRVQRVPRAAGSAGSAGFTRQGSAGSPEGGDVIDAEVGG